MTIRNFTIFKSVLVITAIFVFLCGCERVPQVLEPTTPPVKDSSEQISIGLVLPLTGRHAASFGEPMLRALQIALREIKYSQLAGSNLKFLIFLKIFLMSIDISVMLCCVHENAR